MVQGEDKYRKTHVPQREIWDLAVTVSPIPKDYMSTNPLKLNISFMYLLDYFPYMGIRLLNDKSRAKINCSLCY